MLESLNPLYSDSERLQVSQQIYTWLIQPIESDLKQEKIKTLAFVLDGTLRNIPMSALYDGQRYLIEKYSVAITPGLQLVEPRSLSQSQRLRALVGGLTEGRQGFTPLPGVVRESTQIASELATQIFLDRKLQSKIYSKVFRRQSFLWFI